MRMSARQSYAAPEVQREIPPRPSLLDWHRRGLHCPVRGLHRSQPGCAYRHPDLEAIVTFRIFINRQCVYTGHFASWWTAHDAAINRGILCGARNVQVKPA